VEKVRSFQCSRCGYRFLKQHASVVERCTECSNVVFDHDIQNPFPGIHLSEKYLLTRLDPYARMKYQWYKYPKYHTYVIQNRRVQGDKTYLMQGENKIGQLPEVIV
jgi:DNA-directed RNA polymerase subunit RPC12/RpoP